MIDVTDATFEREVLDRSTQLPVVVDLWAPWCGPCRSLGPIIERVVAATDGAVALAKVNVDENPHVSASFQVQSIPAVYALRDREIVDGFVGALGEAEVKAFVARLLPVASEADLLVAAGDESSLRKALEIDPDHPGAVTGLARLAVESGDFEGALALLARIPETAETAQLAAQARLGASGVDLGGADIAGALEALLDRVKGDEEARRQYLDLLATLGEDDPRSGHYRRALASRLF